MGVRRIQDVDWAGKKALVRVDFNVPFDLSGKQIADDTRIKGSLPTIRYLLDRGAAIILCGHLGRPGGLPRPDLELGPIAKRFAEYLDKRVKYIHDAVGPMAIAEAASLHPGEILLLENIRFFPGEEKNSFIFSQGLALLADVYVNDAFGTAHRAHSSTEGVAHLLPSVPGFLMQKEIEFLGKALGSAASPLAAIFGGAKVSDKVAILDRLVGQTSLILVGGGMAATFLASQGVFVGASPVEESLLRFCNDIFARVRSGQGCIALPKDVVVAEGIEAGADASVVSISEIPPLGMILDIGPETSQLYSRLLKPMRTIIWNGPMGVFEYPQFRYGTFALAESIARSEATTIIGGGSTAEAVTSMGFADMISHVSTGGGASMEFMEGKLLPGVAALENAAS
jgi:phosphoglycerate kinase